MYDLVIWDIFHNYTVLLYQKGFQLYVKIQKWASVRLGNDLMPHFTFRSFWSSTYSNLTTDFDLRVAQDINILHFKEAFGLGVNSTRTLTFFCLTHYSFVPSPSHCIKTTIMELGSWFKYYSSWVWLHVRNCMSSWLAEDELNCKLGPNIVCKALAFSNLLERKNVFLTSAMKGLMPAVHANHYQIPLLNDHCSFKE